MDVPQRTEAHARVLNYIIVLDCIIIIQTADNLDLQASLILDRGSEQENVQMKRRRGGTCY